MIDDTPRFKHYTRMFFSPAALKQWLELDDDFRRYWEYCLKEAANRLQEENVCPEKNGAYIAETMMGRIAVWPEKEEK